MRRPWSQGCPAAGGLHCCGRVGKKAREVSKVRTHHHVVCQALQGKGPQHDAKAAKQHMIAQLQRGSSRAGENG